MPETKEQKPKKVSRVSMVGMGADAFFNPPITREEDQEADQPASQDTSKPVEQGTSTLVNQQAGKPAEQQASTLVSQEASRTASQYTGKPAEQQASTLVSQETGREEYMKATYYITPAQDLKLEQLRLARRQRGERIDKSALIREAIDLLVE